MRPTRQIPAQHKDPGETLKGLLEDARVSLSAIVDTHKHTATMIETVLDRVEALSDSMPQRSKNMKSLLQKWQNLPRTGDCPPLRLLVSTEIEGRGNLKISWVPRLPNYSDQQAFHALLMTELGPSESSLNIPRYRELAVFMRQHATKGPTHDVLAIRYTLWAGIVLGRMLANRFGSIAPTAQAKDIDISLTGDLTEKNLERDQYSDLSSWIKAYSGGIPIEVLHHAHLTGMSALTLRDMCRRSGVENSGHVEISRALKKVRAIVEYNSAWWRTGAIIPLPSPKGLVSARKS